MPGSAGCDMARLSAHDLDKSNAVRSPFGFDMGALDRLYRLRDGRIKSEGLLDHVQVVVDGLRDADDPDIMSPFG